MTDPKKFQDWLRKLDPRDRRYLESHAVWKRSLLLFEDKGVVPVGFVELTMEILEGGSESET